MCVDKMQMDEKKYQFFSNECLLHWNNKKVNLSILIDENWI